MFLNKIKTLFNVYFKKVLPDKRNFIFKLLKKNSLCCEVGVWKGDFTQKIVNKINPKKIYLIDPWKDFGSNYFEKISQKYNQDNQNIRYEFVKKRFKKYIDQKKVLILRKTSSEALDDIKEIKFDFIYLDGNHKYEFIKFDLENYYELLSNHGYMIGDDYRLDGVKRAVSEFILKKNIKNLIVKNDQFIIQKLNFS